MLVAGLEPRMVPGLGSHFFYTHIVGLEPLLEPLLELWTVPGLGSHL
jgi:hypothetical protein